MIFHPMEINTNTRLRWETIKNAKEVKNLTNKKVLDVGAGLGYFSVKFSKLGAKVLAVDADKKSLQYIKRNYFIKTKLLNLNKKFNLKNKFDLIFLGEVLEHLDNPVVFLKNLKRNLKPNGVFIITVPALEGIFIKTKGKNLGHDQGLEKHQKQGFFLWELKKLLSKAGIKIINHQYTIYPISELFMQLTKLLYLKKNKPYLSQIDIISQVNSFKYKFLKLIYPAIFFFLKIEQFLADLFQVKGHCHIITGEIR